MTRLPYIISRYGGSLVHSCRDGALVLEVVDTLGVRSLHFGSSVRQSSMSLLEPERLEMPYLRAMLGALLVVPEPSRVLILGLGAGSVAGFLLRHFPGCRVDAVEASLAVFEVGRDFFGLPESPLLRVFFGDAGDFSALLPRDECVPYDLILVDLFDGSGLSEVVLRENFVVSVLGRLSGCGVIGVNFWKTEPWKLREGLGLLRRHASGGVRRLEVSGRGNVIGFGLGAEVEGVPRRVLESRAIALEQRLGLEFGRFLGAFA